MHNPHALQGYSASNITYPICAVDEGRENILDPLKTFVTKRRV